MGMKYHPREHQPRFGFLTKAVIIIALAIAVTAVVYLKTQKDWLNSPADDEHAVKSRQISLPRLVDLGADKCIPCKMMAPILEELREEYKEKFEVVFIDVWKDPATGRRYGIRLIPTQIFFDAMGKELYRHEGFFSREDILKKWHELGIKFEKGAP
jgi:thioredoxin 1